jgi:branched-chain amino acid transport system permease protein
MSSEPTLVATMRGTRGFDAWRLLAWVAAVLCGVGISALAWAPLGWLVFIVLSAPLALTYFLWTRGQVRVASWSNLLVWAGTIAFVVSVSVQAWAGTPVTVATVRSLVVTALPFAGIYAMFAAGLVVVYTTTGIFNFAQGAIGMFMAYVYWQMSDKSFGWGWPVWLCIPLTVLVLAPLLGIALDRAIMRYLQGQPLVVQLMVTVGLMFAFIGLANMIWNQNNSHSMNALFQSSGVAGGYLNVLGFHLTWHRVFVIVAALALVYIVWWCARRVRDAGGLERLGLAAIALAAVGAFVWFAGLAWNTPDTVRGVTIGDLTLSWHSLIVIGLAIFIALGMRFLLFQTRLGIAMRAVVDNRDLAALEGARASVISSASWAIGCSLAALAGILIAPYTADMSTGTLAFLVISAFAAAVVGRLRSLPLTYLGAFILALSSAYVDKFLNFSARWGMVTNALPTIMLFIVLLLLPRAQLQFSRINPMRRIERVSTVRDTVIGMAFLVAVMWFISGSLSITNLSRFTLGMCTALVALSLVPLIGWAGQVSLAPLAFAGIGAVTYARLGGAHGSIWAVFLAALITAPIGALLALPAMRLQGLYLALLTLAFAAMVDAVFYTQPFAIGSGERSVENVHIFGLDFASQRSLLVLVTIVFGLCGIGIVALRRSAFGRRLIALRDSEAASVTVGVNVFETKLAVFALSAGLAGFAGAFFAMNSHTLTASQTGFDMLTGITIVLALVIGGVGFVAGALFAGVFGLATQIIQDDWHISLWLALIYLAPGLGVLGAIRYPSGQVVPMGEGFARLLPWRKDAKRDYAEQQAANMEPEVGELGITRPFEEADVLLIDRTLGVSNDLIEVPSGTG